MSFSCFHWKLLLKFIFQSHPEFSRSGSKDKFKRKGETRPELQRGGSRDNVRKIVEKEGKSARNLVAWSVPTEKGELEQNVFLLRKRLNGKI